MNEKALALLADLMAQPEGSWNLAEGALAIACLEQPDLDASNYLAQLDRLARQVRKSSHNVTHPRFAAGAISRVLFFDEGFEFDPALEDSPDGVMLNQLFEQRAGSRTLLAVLFVEVARRAGLTFSAAALPGYTLVRGGSGEPPLLFDPSDQGKPVTIERCRDLIVSSNGKKVEFRESMLRPLTAAQLLARLCGQLKQIYWKRTEHPKALAAVQLLLTIRPEDPREIRDQGRLFYLMGRLSEAIQSFENYLHHNPRGEDAEAVRMLLLEARASLSS